MTVGLLLTPTDWRCDLFHPPRGRSFPNCDKPEPSALSLGADVARHDRVNNWFNYEHCGSPKKMMCSTCTFKSLNSENRPHLSGILEKEGNMNWGTINIHKSETLVRQQPYSYGLSNELVLPPTDWFSSQGRWRRFDRPAGPRNRLGQVGGLKPSIFRRSVFYIIPKKMKN